MAETSRPSRVRGALPGVAGISLANKSQLLFGLAAAVILSLSLTVPWIRGALLIGEFEGEEARRLAAAWLDGRIAIAESDVADGPFAPRVMPAERPVDITLVPLVEVSGGGAAVTVPPADSAGDPADTSGPDDRPAELAEAPDASNATGPSGDPPPAAAATAPEASRFVSEAAAAFRADRDRREFTRRYRLAGRSVVRFAAPVTEAMLAGVLERPDRLRPDAGLPEGREPVANRVIAILVIDRDGGFVDGRRIGIQIWILVAGIAGIAASIATFWLILTRLILSPVRRLRETAEAVQEGDLSRRSEIRTGDEFEQLAGAFNIMLDRLQEGRAELEQINRNLDLKVDDLAKANVDLDESNRLKSEFVASVSHELRTPLNSIIGFAELLQELARGESEVDPKRMRYLDNIVGSGRSLLEMINELLDMAKIEAGRMEVSIAPTSVADIVEGLVRIMGPQSQAKGIDLSTDVEDGLAAVETDAGKIQQVLYNFLSNAVKFTPEEGSITVGARREYDRDRIAHVRLWVRDSGPGISADMQELIFEKFRQADATHTREHAGTGLGLAICKSLADMLGATVACESRPGEGSTFSVLVPVRWMPEEPPPLMP